MELVKREDHYGLYNDDGHKIAATLDGCNSKLSKQNCDEIFGVIDVDKLAKEETRKYLPGCPENIMNFIAHERFFKIAFEQAMELNKDKLFTVEDMKKAILWAHDRSTEGVYLSRLPVDRFIQSLQQPTEIEVEIEQVLVQSSIEGEVIWKYKLDNNGCLILKKL